MLPKAKIIFQALFLIAHGYANRLQTSNRISKQLELIFDRAVKTLKGRFEKIFVFYSFDFDNKHKSMEQHYNQ